MRIFLLVLLSFGYSSIIKVPAHQPTIQEGINAAVDGDIVVVYPDTYFENILIDKSIILTSLALFDTTTNTLLDSLETWTSGNSGNIIVSDDFINSTIIDGSMGDNSTVTIAGNDCIEPEILGFTIRGGKGTEMDRFYEDPEGGTITVKQHLVGGIFSFKSNPKVHYNKIQDNGVLGDVETGAAIYSASSDEDCDFPLRRQSSSFECDNDSYDF